MPPRSPLTVLTIPVTGAVAPPVAPPRTGKVPRFNKPPVTPVSEPSWLRIGKVPKFNKLPPRRLLIGKLNGRAGRPPLVSPPLPTGLLPRRDKFPVIWPRV